MSTWSLKTCSKKYRSARAFAEAEQSELENDIRSTGFFRNKTKNIIAACGDIVGKHKGKVPQTREELTDLPGVGRKTANVVLANAYGIPAVVTDTHVIRLSRLLGLSKNNDPVKLEYDLMELFPEADWADLSHLLIWHGRKTCICPSSTLLRVRIKATLRFWQRVITVSYANVKGPGGDYKFINSQLFVSLG